MFKMEVYEKIKDPFIKRQFDLVSDELNKLRRRIEDVETENEELRSKVKTIEENNL